MRKPETDLERIAVMEGAGLPFKMAAVLTVSDEELAAALARDAQMADIGMTRPVTDDPIKKLALVYLAYHRPDLVGIDAYELEIPA